MRFLVDVEIPTQGCVYAVPTKGGPDELRVPPKGLAVEILTMAIFRWEASSLVHLGFEL